MLKLKLKLASWLSSPRLTAFLLLYSVLFIFLATLEIPSNGISYVQEKYFASWFCFWGYMPLFGGKAIGLAAIVNLIASAFRFGGRGVAGIGFAMVHISLVMLIISGFLQNAWRTEGVIVLDEGKPNHIIIESARDGSKNSLALPFSVELVKFNRENWPNTNTPRQFSSSVKFHSENFVQEKLIRMNDPASFGSWTFYQSSYANEGKTSVLQAVHNPAGLLPLLSIIFIFAGMIIIYSHKIFVRK